MKNLCGLRGLGHVVLAAGIGALCHVGDCGTHVSIGPKCPVEFDVGASSSFGMEGSRLRAKHSTSSVSTTLDIRDGYILDRSIALDRTRDTLHCGCVRVGVWLVEGIVGSADSGIVHISMGSNGGSEGEG